MRAFGQSSSIGASLLIALALSSAASAQTPPVGGYTIHAPGLYGPEYQRVDESGITRTDVISELLSSGSAIGTTTRWDSAGAGSIGYDGWFFNGSTTQRINLTGPGYETSYSGSIYRSGYGFLMNDAAMVGGFSTRFASTGVVEIGHDAWLFNGVSTQVVNPTGGIYQYAATDGVHREGQLHGLNNAGQISGMSQRFSATGDDLGYDSWRYSGGVHQIVGLTGPGYEYATPSGTYRVTGSWGINDAGQMAGHSRRFDSTGTPLGSDAWRFNGATSQLIGLTGAEYQYTTPLGIYREAFSENISASGHVMGNNNRFSPTGIFLGRDVWRSDGTSTQRINPTGGVYDLPTPDGVFRQADEWDINPSDQIVGIIMRNASSSSDLGTDVWLFNGTTTSVINMTGPGYEYPATGGVYRSGGIGSLGNSGHVVGQSDRWASNGDNLGSDTWLFNGVSPKVISLTGSIYERVDPSGNYRSSASSEMNDSDFVVGTSDRYGASDDLGKAGWVYDPITDLTTPLEFSFRDDGYSYTDPQTVTDSGVVLGSYELFSGATSQGLHAFWWSGESGFHDLGSLVSGGLSNNGWSALIDSNLAAGNFSGDGPNYIAGLGARTGEPTDSYGSAYILSAQTPEPAGLAMLSLAAALRRRRAA